jgi:ADP-ribose pyrophosphatase YjhB (NUDIX family)
MEPHEEYKYCPNCRNALDYVENAKVVCPACGFSRHFNPYPGCGVIIYNDKYEILLVKRNRNPHINTWQIPGGFFMNGERMETAMVREIKEEIGIELQEKDLEFVGAESDRYLYNKINSYVSGFFTRAKLPENQAIKAADDAEEFRFFKLDEIPFADIGFPSNQRILKLYLQKYGSL